MTAKKTQSRPSINLQTDLACELVEGKLLQSGESVRRSDVFLDARLSKKFNKPKGTYITVESDAVLSAAKGVYAKIARELKNAIRELAAPLDNVLVVGLGNPNLTADALGNAVCKRLLVTRHLEGTKAETKQKLCALCPNVLGVTGIESFDIIKGVVLRIKPDCVLVVDSLASAAVSRIASAFQVGDGGITPGSGVGNCRIALNRKNLGVPVVSVGVPLVVYATTIIREAVKNAPKKCQAEVLNSCGQLSTLVVTPKDIDMLLSDCAEIISTAINTAVFADFSPADIQLLRV